MNLHGLVAPCVAVINPWLTVMIRQADGYTTGADGTQVPNYTETSAQAQCQALQYNDLQQMSGLNIQGRRQALYITGDWEGLVRSEAKGGDVIIFPDGSVWIAVMVLEPWADTAGWTKLCVTLQEGS
jgi:hypothetical protein